MLAIGVNDIYVKIVPILTGPLVVALLYDGLCTFEFGIVAEIFGLARPEMGTDWYRFASCAIEEGPLRAHGGLKFVADHGPEILDGADLIVVPGWKGADSPVPEALVERLRAAHNRGARLASICSGAFVLAATGLIAGGTATTHWRYSEALRGRFPDITVDDASLYRIHDRVCTSAGSAAGIDLMIELIRQDYGAAAANSVARRLVMPAHRAGGQAQFLQRPVATRDALSVSPTLERVRATLGQRWTIDGMAKDARMSTRTFLRRFAEATGTAPGEWLVSERLAEAKQLLCLADPVLEDIAVRVGFGSLATMRHHFRRRLGISPGEYRSRFLTEGRIAPMPAMPTQ